MKTTTTTKRRRSKPFGFLTHKGEIVRRGTLEKYSIKKAPAGSKQVREDPFTSSYADKGIIEPTYNPNSLIVLPEVNTYHNRCCKQKALDVAGGGWTLQSTTDGEGSDVNKKKLMEFFNSLPYDLWRKSHQDLEELGYAAVELIREGDRPDGLYIKAAYIPAHTVRIHQDETKYLQTRGSNKVWFKAVDYEGEINKDTGDELSPESLGSRANELLWITNHTARSDYYGFPDIIPAIPVIYGEQGRAEYNVAFFENYGIPTFAITVTGDFEEGEEDDETLLTDLETALQRQLQTIQQNPHSAMVITIPSRDGLPGESKVDVKFERLSTDTKEASFRLYRTDNRDEVLSAHGMDPYRIGVVQEGSLGGNTAIESKKSYKYGVVQPRQQAWEELINQVIVRDNYQVMDWAFKFNPIDLEDEAADLNELERLMNMAVITPSQLIGLYGEKYGLEPAKHPALDAHYLNGVPLDYTPETPATPDMVVEGLKRLRDGIVEAIDEDNNSKKDSGLGGRLSKRVRSAVSS